MTKLLNFEMARLSVKGVNMNERQLNKALAGKVRGCLEADEWWLVDALPEILVHSEYVAAHYDEFGKTRKAILKTIADLTERQAAYHLVSEEQLKQSPRLSQKIKATESDYVGVIALAHQALKAFNGNGGRRVDYWHRVVLHGLFRAFALKGQVPTGKIYEPLSAVTGELHAHRHGGDPERQRIPPRDIQFLRRKWKAGQDIFERILPTDWPIQRPTLRKRQP
jgi:hypothetical protein